MLTTTHSAKTKTRRAKHPHDYEFYIQQAVVSKLTPEETGELVTAALRALQGKRVPPREWTDALAALVVAAQAAQES